jgi:hypothetical protein
MVLLRLALVCALGVPLLLPPAAAAGGWWSSVHVSRSLVAPGERVEVEATVAFASVAEAREAGRFYVHLLRGFDYSVVDRAMREPSPRNWWSLGDAEAIRVGEARVSVSNVNLGRVTAAFTLPELPPATYHLMLCDAACTEPLADVIPATGFTVVADPATARLVRRADRLERGSREQARRLATARIVADTALAAARDAGSEVERLEAGVPAPASGSTSWAFAGWFAAGLLLGALALLVLRTRSGRARPRPPAPPLARRSGRHLRVEPLVERRTRERRVRARE